MCETAILNEENTYPLNISNGNLEGDEEIFEEYKDHINSDYVSDVLPFNTFKRLYNEFQELSELERPWTEGEDRRVSELCKRLGY